MRTIAIPPAKPLLSEGESAPNAPLAAEPEKLPLIVISHANGSFGMQMSWLGSALAASGYVAAAVDHPGDNFLTGTTVQGATFTWLRATDLSRAIDGVLADNRFAARIDRSIAELPNYRQRAAELEKTDAAFRAALAQAGNSYQDARVRAVFSIAPAFSPELTQASLRAISIPVAIVGGIDDPIAVVGDNMIPDAMTIPTAQLYLFERPIAHFTFIDQCTAAGAAQFATSCADSGPLRATVHQRTIDLALGFFARSL
jgi:predicted dienelactone hydrolase